MQGCRPFADVTVSSLPHALYHRKLGVAASSISVCLSPDAVYVSGASFADHAVQQELKRWAG